VSSLILPLLSLYGPLCAAIIAGLTISCSLNPVPKLQAQVPGYLGKFLFYLGVPLSILNFVYRAELTDAILLAPLVAWTAMLMALTLAWGITQLSPIGRQRSISRGSFLLTAMLGNTGYLGFPVVLLLPQLGPDYFSWALFYDLLGTLFGAYLLGVILAAYFSQPCGQYQALEGAWLTRQLLLNPSLWAFGGGLLLQPMALPPMLATGLNTFAWLMVLLALLLMGMRLQQLSSWRQLQRAAAPVSIKMLAVPLLVGLGLSWLGIEGPTRLVLTLQSGMPCAFATLVLTETYQLDYELTVTAVGLSSGLLLITLPVWVYWFG
jgi:hypothetical protein